MNDLASFLTCRGVLCSNNFAIFWMWKWVWNWETWDEVAFHRMHFARHHWAAKNMLVTVLLPSSRKLTRFTLPAGRNNLQTWLKLKSEKTSGVKYIPQKREAKRHAWPRSLLQSRPDSLIQKLQRYSNSPYGFKLGTSDIFDTSRRSGDCYHKCHYYFLEVI